MIISEEKISSLFFSLAKICRNSMMFINSLVCPSQELSDPLDLLGQLLDVLQVLATIGGVEEQDLLLDPSQSVVRVTLERMHGTGHGKSCPISLLAKH